MRKIVAASLMVLAGCQTGEVDMTTQFEDYVRCNHRNAVKFAKQQGDALSLAIAAEASCPAETVALLHKLNEAKGPGRALEMMRNFEQSAIRSNVGTIARVRS